MSTANDEIDRVAFFYSDLLGYEYVSNTHAHRRVTNQPIQGRSHEVRFIRVPQPKADGDIVSAPIKRHHRGSAQGDANKSQNVNQREYHSFHLVFLLSCRTHDIVSIILRGRAPFAPAKAHGKPSGGTSQTVQQMSLLSSSEN